jgi:hypothetical protein
LPTFFAKILTLFLKLSTNKINYAGLKGTVFRILSNIFHSAHDSNSELSSIPNWREGVGGGREDGVKGEERGRE